MIHPWIRGLKHMFSHVSTTCEKVPNSPDSRRFPVADWPRGFALLRATCGFLRPGATPEIIHFWGGFSMKQSSDCWNSHHFGNPHLPTCWCLFFLIIRGKYSIPGTSGYRLWRVYAHVMHILHSNRMCKIWKAIVPLNCLNTVLPLLYFFPNHISTHNSLLGCASQIVNGAQPMLKHFTYNRGIIELLLPTGRYEDNGHPKLINKPCIIIIDIF